FWEQHGGLILLAAFLALAAAALWLKWRRRVKPAAGVPPEVVARAALGRLRGSTEDAAVVAEVSRIFRQYVMAVFGLPGGELTTTELHHALQSHPQATPDLTNAVIEFLRHCDEWKFAPVPPPLPLTAVDSAM